VQHSVSSMPDPKLAVILPNIYCTVRRGGYLDTTVTWLQPQSSFLAVEFRIFSVVERVSLQHQHHHHHHQHHAPVCTRLGLRNASLTYIHIVQCSSDAGLVSRKNLYTRALRCCCWQLLLLVEQMMQQTGR
jgi:hypothetical protein